MRFFLAFLLLGACLCVVTAADQAAGTETSKQSVSSIETSPEITAQAKSVMAADVVGKAKPAAATSAALAVKTDPQTMVDLLNPAQNNTATDTSVLLGEPASTIGKKIKHTTWFAIAIFMPFLFIPQILLVYIIFKYRDSKGKRKSATFLGHHKLEFVWTAIPILVLLIVTVPVVKLLYEQELPPIAVANGEAMEVRITGKKFNWVYDYPDQDIKGLNTHLMEFSPEIEGTKDPVTVIMQEPAVFEKGRVTTLFFSSLDVTHAWGVQALAVKKDCFVDRVNHSWFESDVTGFFEGQCYELCGASHGYMVITTVILEPAQFDQWVDYMHARSAANPVIAALRSGDGAADSVKEYLKDNASNERKDALRYWLKYEYAAKILYLQDNQHYIKEPWIAAAVEKTKAYLSSQESELNNLMRPFKDQAQLQSAVQHSNGPAESGSVSGTDKSVAVVATSTVGAQQ